MSRLVHKMLKVFNALMKYPISLQNIYHDRFQGRHTRGGGDGRSSEFSRLKYSAETRLSKWCKR